MGSANARVARLAAARFPCHHRRNGRIAHGIANARAVLRMDTAIAIRTMVITPDGASVQAGAGVVYDSDPELEHNECFHKASALLAAVPAAERLTAARRAQRTPESE